MSDYIKEFTHELLEPFDYANTKSGEKEQVKRVTVKAPSRANKMECMALEQIFIKAGLNAQKNVQVKEQDKVDVKSEKKDMTATDIIMMLYIGDADIEKCFTIFKKIACNVKAECVLINGTEIMTEYLYDQLSIEDLKALFGGYLANFLVSSLNR